MKKTITVKKKNPSPDLTDILKRIEELEIANDSTQSRLAILYELLEIVKELPNGKAIYNRAINRYKLKYLKNVVLPRRTKELMDLSHSLMPKGIRSMFVDQQVSLIKRATKAIRHRENYENAATYHVRSILSHVFSNFLRQRSRLSLSSPHHKEA